MGDHFCDTLSFDNDTYHFIRLDGLEMTLLDSIDQYILTLKYYM